MTQFKSLVENPNISEILRKNSPEKTAVKGLQKVLFELGFQEEPQWNKWGADGGYWFCDLEGTDAYIKIDEPFRGASYFAAITDQQYDSLISLLRYLVQEFDIPSNFLEAGFYYLRRRWS